MAIVLFDNQQRNLLYPLSATKAVAALRFGILTQQERWGMRSNQQVFIHTEKYLQPLYATIPDGEHIWIDACVLADKNISEKILSLSVNYALADEYGLVACKLSIKLGEFDANEILSSCKEVKDVGEVRRLQYPWQIFQWNDAIIVQDFEWVTKGRVSQSISHTNQVIQGHPIFIEEGASVTYSMLNSNVAPIYIGKNATVMEGTFIRGPFALGEGSVIKMGAKIYGATTIGPYSVAGGEIKNAVIQGYSNKAHDGYLGDSVIGEWCNMGAGTTNSNVKNTASDVKVYSKYEEKVVSAGQKCGVIMGDYSRTAINSSINTGSIIGVCSNVFGAGLLPKVIDDFSWGVADEKYELDKALKDIDNWKKLKHKSLSDAESFMLKHIFEAEMMRIGKI
jgi:UDP-N-acetylglucosamine diphosphorylase/glucosamine-1-phosphate N-acetyltransferase